MAGAGELFRVLGKTRFSTSPGCPDSLRGKTIKLVTADDAELPLPAEVAFIALRVKAVVERDGSEAPVPVPFKRSLMVKVAEYLKHHGDVPVSEIKMPLESTDLVDCGVEKWDAAFINVDKDTLFDLMLGAAVLEIAGLYMLCGAKLAAIVKDKPVEKLLKEFNYRNDASEVEINELQQGFEEARYNLGFGATGGENHITQSLVAMNGVAKAAEKHGLLEGSSSVTGFESWRQAAWRTAVLMNWPLIFKAPRDLQRDRSLMEAVGKASLGAGLAGASEDLKADKTLILSVAAVAGGKALQHATPELRSDRGFVLECMKANAESLSGAAPEVRADREFVLQAAAELGHGGGALQGAAPELCGDMNLVTAATLSDPACFKYADERLRLDKDFVLSLVQKCGAVLQYLPGKFKADPEVVQEAIVSDEAAAAFAHVSRRTDLRYMNAEDGEPESREFSMQKVEGELLVSDSYTTLMRHLLPGEATWSYAVKAAKAVFFSGFGTVFGTMGQANYLAANSVLERMSEFLRADTEYATVLWGGIGGVGMRLKAFGSMDVLNQAPENLLPVPDARKCLQAICGLMSVPEVFGCSASDMYSRENMLRLTAGGGTGGGWKPGEAVSIVNPPGGQQRAKVASADGERGAPGEGPLGGWPALHAPAALFLDIPVTEGCRVMLSGLRSKNGATGIAAKLMAQGRWKVKMDDGSGNALLPVDNLRVVATREDAVAGIGVSTGVVEEKDVRWAAEVKALQAKEELQRKRNEESARRLRLAEEKAAEDERTALAVEAERRKRTGVPGLLRRVRPSWNDYAVELLMRSLASVGLESLGTLRLALEPAEKGVPRVNELLTAAGLSPLAEELVSTMREHCDAAGAATAVAT